MKEMKHQFTHHNFTELIKTLKKSGYNFLGFPLARENLKVGKSFCLLRHDVDYDLYKALELAEIENEMGVAATYFFLLRTKKYNILEKSSTKAVKAILALGHKLGLHFDCAEYPNYNSPEELTQACQQEINIVETWFKSRVDAVSFHNPPPNVLESPDAFEMQVPHTYLPIYTQEITYVSDSCGEWKYGHPTSLKAFKDKNPLHILMHPIWWNKQHCGALQVLARHLNKVTVDYQQNMARESRIYKADL
jgi:hypothetical protein